MIGEHGNARRQEAWPLAQECRLDDLRRLVERGTDPRDVPLAERVVHDVPVYRGAIFAEAMGDPAATRTLATELVDAMLDGPGIVVIESAFPDRAVIDRVTEEFDAMIAEQHAAGSVAGDHFAAPGANDRVWNALEKLARRAPDDFCAYYENPVIAFVAGAWLGPAYQVTSQVNVVNPGGAAQAPHRDYHLGFQSDPVAERFPAHAHRLSAVLTLQGAVAHCDMPVATGPTMYLPHSQAYPLGYLAWRRPEFQAYFAERHVQLPLRAGDAVFFNPALLHGAGANRSGDVRRMANLLQISSPFGRAMESVDRAAMCRAVYPALLARAAGGWPADAVQRVVAATAEGYAFPTNLDRDQPIGGLAPESQADVFRTAITERWTEARLATALDEHAARRLT